MARQFLVLAVLAVMGTAAWAQNPETPAPKPEGSPAAPSPAFKKPNKPDHAFQKSGDPAEFAQKLFDRLTPEENARFKENFERWKALPPEERQTLMMHEKFRRERILKEIDDAIAQSGLQFDSDRKEVFVLRYTQERRKIEEQLRREMEKKRHPMLNDMIDRLVKEFSSKSTPAPSPQPAKE